MTEREREHLAMEMGWLADALFVRACRAAGLDPAITIRAPLLWLGLYQTRQEARH